MAKGSNRNTSAVTHGRPDGINNVIVSGQNLTIADVVNVAQYGANVSLTDDEQVLQRVQASSDYIREAVENHEPIYGVTTGFGGMSGVVIPVEDANELQNHLIWAHKTGTGLRLPGADVRAGMLIRANSFLIGISGIRLSFIRRIETFLNADVTPHVYQLGSIGASGDLVPLSYIAGALTGLNAGYKVDFKGEEIDSIDALKRLDLPRMSLGPKEGLAIMNGTSLMTGIAANC
ncbi:MAG: aromatic amino acid lyase, partial [Candidatus Anammoxibacter sp.]